MNPLFDAIVSAHQQLRPQVRVTPLERSVLLSQQLGCELYLKCDHLQHTGSFKFRGASNKLRLLDSEQRRRGVIAASTGNHGQAVALAGQLMGVGVTVYAPETAASIKLDTIRALGGTVELVPGDALNAELAGEQAAREQGKTYISPYNDEQVIAGQGTAAKELFEETGPLDLLLVCTGGGGLLAGSAVAAHHWSPGCRVFGVEPEAGNDVQQAFQRGEPVHIPVPKTLADGAQTQQVGQLTFPIIQAYVEGILTVSDAQLCRQMRFFMERMKMVVEPTGCLAAAAAMNGLLDLHGKKVGVIVSGGNLDVDKIAHYLALAGEN